MPLLKTELLEFSLPTGPIECELVRPPFVEELSLCVYTLTSPTLFEKKVD